MPLRPSATFVRSIAASAGVAVAAFVFAEVALRAFAPQTPRTEAAESRAVPDSLLGYRYRPGSFARHTTPEFSVEYSIDERGLRRRSSPAREDSSAARWLVVGDSFTFGDGNNEDDTWVRVVERDLKKRTGADVNLINAGVEGYDTRSELLFLKELVPVIAPRGVLVGFSANDVYTNTPVTAAPSIGVAVKRKDGGLFPLHVVELSKRMITKNDRVFARIFLLTGRRAYYESQPGPRAARQIETTAALITDLASYCRERGIPCYVVSIPQRFAVISAARGFNFDGVDPAVIDTKLAPVAREHGAEWIDTLPRLAAAQRLSSEDLYYRVDGHLTPAGNRVLGGLVAETIRLSP